MSSFFDDIKKEAKLGWEQANEKEKLARERKTAKEESRRRMYVPGSSFLVAKNFKTRLYTKGMLGAKMRDRGKHWVRVGGERNIEFLRHEKGKLAFSVRWGLGKNYWEMRLTEREALDYLVPNIPFAPASSGFSDDVASTSASTAEQLREMKGLFDEGIITKEDFEKFKASLLG